MNSNLKEVKTDLQAVAEQYLKFLPSGNNIDPQTKLQFLEVCKNFELNPFKKEIYLILRRQKDKSGNYVDVFNIVVGYEAYRRRAENIGDMDGGITIDTLIDEQTGLPVKSTATLYRKGKTHAYSKTVYFAEFAQKTADGRLMSLWATKPIFMLEKVAEATLLRMAYPCEFRNMPYISEELPSTNVVETEVADDQQNSKQVVREEVVLPKAKEEVVKELKKELSSEIEEQELTIDSISKSISKTGKNYFKVKDMKGNTFISFDEKIIGNDGATIKAKISCTGKAKIIKSFQDCVQVPF